MEAAHADAGSSLASELLAAEDFSEESCLRLLRLHFSRPQKNRRKSVLGDAVFAPYHILGFFSSSSGRGLTNFCFEEPVVVEYVNAWLRRFFPDDVWCSIAISLNRTSNIHVDQGNDPSIPNKCITLGSHEGGLLWIQDSQGPAPYIDSSGRSWRGRFHDVRMQPCRFPPHVLHGSALSPCTGERWMLAAYVPEAFHSEGGIIREDLLRLRFPLPPGTSAGSPGVLAVPVSSSGHRQVLSGSPTTSSLTRQVLADSPGVDDTVCDARPLAQLLVAARPVTWRGGGDLLQVPWARAPPGRWLILDLWAGYSGLCIAALTAGLHFYAIAAESDPVARQVAQAVMPSIVPVSDVHMIQVDILLPFVQKRSPRGIIVGGGTPCQPLSTLNRSRQGLRDPRAQAPAFLHDLVRDLRAHPKLTGIEVILFLENVASMDHKARDQFSHWAGSPPVCIRAADCGWTQRNRLYWLVGRSKALSPDSCEAPMDWSWDTGGAEAVPRLRYVGSKPVPARVYFEDGFRLLQDPLLVMKGEAEPVFTFSREFFHPTDNMRDVPAQACQRFFDDARRFPPGAYVETSLLWKGERWRTPSPAERAQMLGSPPSATAAVTGSQDERVRLRNSLLGNGFHIPSILVLFSLLSVMCDAKVQFMPDPTLSSIRARTEHTLWGGDWLYRAPGLLSAADVILDMQCQFPDIVVAPEVWHQCQHGLSHCDLALPQAFSCFQRSLGRDWTGCPPRPLLARDRTRIFASNSGQRYSSEESRGLDFLLPPGLGKLGHLRASGTLPSPFLSSRWPDDDVDFVAYTISVWQDLLPYLAQRQRRALRSIKAAVRPLLSVLYGSRSESSRKVASGKDPAFLACMTSLLRWPDRSQAMDFVSGFPIVGEIERSGVFREVRPRDADHPADWLGPPAALAVDAILSSPPPRFAADILEVTTKEIEKGFCSPLLSRVEVDKIFGHGGWRPLERFLIQQGDGKKRVIDNARKTGHNGHVQMLETIFTVSVDFIACVIRDVLAQVSARCPSPEPDVPSWIQVRVGTDDLPDAYRGHPVRHDHQRYSVIALFVPGTGWRFSILWGLAYGLEAAVVGFNRFPTFGVAMARRCTSSMCAAYFDDELSVEFLHGSCTSQVSLRLCFGLLGAPPQPSKSFPPAADRHYLGTSVHVGDAALDHTICIQPKFMTVQKVESKIQTILSAGFMDRDTAGKLRGDVLWLFSACSGFAGKFAGPVLSKYQYGDQPELDEAARAVLDCLRRMVISARPRFISIFGPPAPLLRIYSDASFEGGVLRLGWLLFDGDVCVVAGTAAVPDQLLSSWKQRKQQIFPGESLCMLVVPLLHGAHLQDRDAIWFVDNMGALSASIKGGSREVDVHLIALAAASLRTPLAFRPWFEWVDSDSNPSDGLSRLGVSCDLCETQGWPASEFELPIEIFSPAQLCSDSLLSISPETMGV